MTVDANDLARQVGADGLRYVWDTITINQTKGMGPSLICRCTSEIELEPVEWLWLGRLARGKHTCIAGEPGTGKSQLATFIAATISVGGQWPCGEGRAPQGNVIILSAEDGESDTIVPRLHAAEADCGGVYTISAVKLEDGEGRRSFSLQTDLKLLEQKIGEIGNIALIVVDPISSYLGKTDSHKNAEVRGVLEPLGEMAERLRVAVLSVTHFSKGSVGTATKALHKFIGSIAFVGAPRAAFAVLEDPDDADRRLFLHAKNNLASPPPGLAFGLEQVIVGEPGKGITASRVRWEAEPVTITANEALAAESGNGESRSAKDEAGTFLRELLADGPIAAKDVKREAEEAGIAPRTLKRAKHILGVLARREGGIADSGKWTWSLPKETSPSLTGPLEKLAPLVPLDDFCPFPEGQMPKGAKHLNGPLIDQTSGEADRVAGLKGPSMNSQEYPELPAFLDRRAANGGAGC